MVYPKHGQGIACFTLCVVLKGYALKRMSGFSIRSLVLAMVVVLGLAKADSFPLEDVSPGLLGYALTAAAGNQIERFPVQVLGIQQDVGTGFPLVLIKASGPFMEETGGVAAGMSGSPVYLPGNSGDALLGAIAYVFPSSDHSLALVTPIEIMRGIKPQALSFSPSGPAFADFGQYLPVATPLLFSGLSERASSRLAPLFRNPMLNSFPVQLGGGASSWDESSYRLEPGSAISVQLAKGDVTLAAVGTVTAIEGKHVLAFGHPFFGEGEVSFAFAPAFVSYIVPSNVVPFKLANNGKTILGAIHEDRPSAILGSLGGKPDFLPVTLSLKAKDKSFSKQIEISNDERYYAPLLAAVVIQVFDEAYQKIAAGTADLAWEISLLNGTVIRILEQVSDSRDLSSVVASLAAEPLQILASNIFEDVKISHIALNISYEEQERYADIVEVVSDQEEHKQGELVTVHIRLQPYRADPEVKTLRLELPKAAEGSLDITVRGGMEGAGEDPDAKPILSFAELIVALSDHIESTELIVETYVEGKRQELERLRLPYLIQGEKTLSITILAEDESTAEINEPSSEKDEEADLVLP